MTLTSTYPFDQMSVGDSFTVRERHQHARVAASEYARRNGMAFTCRVQEDGTMRVIRCENNQAYVDMRGRRGKRRIVQALAEPNKQEFTEWLATFSVGQRYVMPSVYHHVFAAMEAWCELASLRSPMRYSTERIGAQLAITRTI